MLYLIPFLGIIAHSRLPPPPTLGAHVNCVQCPPGKELQNYSSMTALVILKLFFFSF